MMQKTCSTQCPPWLLKQVMSGVKCTKEVCIFFSKYNHYPVCSTMASQVKKITDNIYDIAKDGEDSRFRIRGLGWLGCGDRLRVEGKLVLWSALPHWGKGRVFWAYYGC